uniref:Beta-hexosaminidase subunit alpha n=1 Tax=Culex pipiens TaxID=7175 RepID=A0A8D8GRC6_CULPI
MKYVLLLLNTWFLYTNGAYSYIVDPGPVVKATKGEIWPKPKSQTTNAKFAMINRSAFQFQISNHTCDILEKAIERYQKLTLDVGNSARRSLFRSSRGRNDQGRKSPRSDGNFKKTLEVMQLNLKTPCESLPYLSMDESYDLVIDDTQASIESFSVWGMLRGLESFSQMVILSDDGSMVS